MSDERPGGSIRIGDSEREDAVRRLGEHYEAGRLSAEEHSERVEQALRAKTAADLTALFGDLPGPHQTPHDSAADAPHAAGGDGDGEGWAGPWGWRKPPWTAPEDATAANGPGNAGRAPGSGGFAGPGGAADPGWAGGGRPPWAARGFLGRIPLPLLMLLGAFAVLASVGCVVGGGHPPVLPLLLIVGAVLFVRKRRTERRA